MYNKYKIIYFCTLKILYPLILLNSYLYILVVFLWVLWMSMLVIILNANKKSVASWYHCFPYFPALARTFSKILRNRSHREHFCLATLPSFLSHLSFPTESSLFSFLPFCSSFSECLLVTNFLNFCLTKNDLTLTFYTR